MKKTEVEFSPPDIFLCPRIPGGLRLSPASCATSYLRGKKAESWETAYTCRGCEIGAGHAGESPTKASERESVGRPRYQCVCGATGQRLIHDIICVSCYNRIAEALRGRNARGKPPTKWRPVVLSDMKFVRHGHFVFVARREKLTIIARIPPVLPGTEQCLWDTSHAD